jgi:hypothetical protein
MQCPYCTSGIDENALACPYCTRDLHLVKQLLERITTLERHLDESGISSWSEGSEADESAAPQAEPEEVWQAPPPRYGASLLFILLPALALLVAAHGVLFFLYDIKPIYLRIASMLIPIPFGFALFRRNPRRLGLSVLAGFAMACGAVLGMSTVTALVDHVPILPQDAREVREVLEYAASIGLSFCTGLLLSVAIGWKEGGRHKAGLVVRLISTLFSKDHKGQWGIERLSKQLQPIINVLTLIATAIAALYTGIKALLSG